MINIFRSLVTLLIILFSTNVTANDWSYQAEIYMQATHIEGKTWIGKVVNDASISIDSEDIFDSLELGGMFHAEALNNQSGWGLVVDYAFMDLSPNSSSEVVDVKVWQGVMEALLFKRIQLTNSHIDYFGGVRWWDNKIELEAGSSKYSLKETWVDAVIGARLLKPLDDKWTIMFKGDLGGFGLSADFTSNITIGGRCKIADNFSLDLQYKAVWVDYKTGNKREEGYFAYDTVTHGPIIGLVYHF